VQTTVRRLTPPGTAVVLEIPLLAGENVTTQDVRVQNGRALVNMAPQVNEASWTSTLEEKTPLTLEAPKGLPWTEVCGSTFLRCARRAERHSDGAPAGRRVRGCPSGPWPAETVRVDATRPRA